MDTDLNALKNFINDPHCDLGSNAWILADLVCTFKNARFDLAREGKRGKKVVLWSEKKMACLKI